jgi:hypothetical protein
MSKGILIYALNNEQVDYVKIAYNAAKQAKKHLKLPIAIVTDSAEWLKQQFPDYTSIFDIVIKIVHESTVENWQSNKYYGVGSLAFHNGTIWRKVKEGNEVVNVVNKTFKTKIINEHFVPVYEGIDIDKWYPNLPYLSGQHVWYNNVLYRCHTDYEEKNEFSIDKYDVLVENVFDYETDIEYTLGNILLYNRTLWQAIRNKFQNEIPFNRDNFEAIYIGLDIDKWYPNLPYLAGQHVWHKKTLYKCHTSYEEKDSFSVDKYDLVIENILEYEKTNDIEHGDIVLYDRKLWLSHISFGIVKAEHDLSNFDRIYEGINIDKWYPNLPYLKGQHVWYEDVLYRCEIGYTEQDNFSKDKYIVILEDVYDLEKTENYNKGEIFLHNRVLWQANTNFGLDQELVSVWYNMEDLERVYEGIDIDKWYPNLPYLAGQHVWYENILYRCNVDYEEQDIFSLDKYDIILENVKDLTNLNKFSIGDIILHDRVLWLSKINYDSSLNNEKIRDDIWEDTRERHLVWNSSPQYRRYFDGSLTYKRLKFKNDIRIKSFELSPFDETLVIDCDYFINNDKLKHCWEQPHDFLIFKDAMDLSGYRNDPRLKSVSDKSIDFYWATVFFFRKNSNTEIFFNYLGHIQENWNYYRHIYQIDHSLYRNDYAFSIAIHVMNGYQKGNWAYSLPGKLYYTTDRDLLMDYKNQSMKFLIEKQNYKGEYTLIKIDNLNVHVMNKFSLSRILDDIHNVEHSL